MLVQLSSEEKILEAGQEETVHGSSCCNQSSSFFILLIHFIKPEVKFLTVLE